MPYVYNKDGVLIYKRVGEPENPKQKEDKESNLLFVYGTLRYHNKYLLKDAKLINKGTSAPSSSLAIYHDLPVQICHPNMDSGNFVIGDTYLVNDEILEEIDAFKLRKGLYERKRIRIGAYGGDAAWSYVYPKQDPNGLPVGFKVIEDRDYGKYLDSLIDEDELLNE